MRRWREWAAAATSARRAARRERRRQERIAGGRRGKRQVWEEEGSWQVLVHCFDPFDYRPSHPRRDVKVASGDWCRSNVLVVSVRHTRTGH